MRQLLTLTGGLGNQFFQSVFADAYNHQHSESIVLDASKMRFPEHEKSDIRPILHDLEIDVTNDPGLLEMLARLAELVIEKKSKNQKSNSKPFDLRPKFTENSHTSHPIFVGPQNYQKARRFIGYFQDSSYFASLPKDRKEMWRSSFQRTLTPLLKEVPDLVVHLRLGDYRKRSDLLKLEEDYYDYAIARFGAAKRRFLVSDEPESEEARLLATKWNLTILVGLSPEQTIGLLSQSNGIVIANSSLSFAGALLSTRSEVCAPSEWGKVNKNLPSSKRGSFPKHWNFVNLPHRHGGIA